MKIAACYIARNEAETISRSFQGLAEQVDGIFLADTGSTDDTLNIAKAAGAQVFSYPWQEDFAAARNFILAQVPDSYDWILFLDADEYLVQPSELRPFLQQIEKQHPEKEAVLVTIVNIDADNGNREFHRFLNIRLFRHTADICYAGRVHEMIQHKSGRPLEVLVERNRLTIHHTGYSHRIVQKKIRRNLALLQTDIDEHGEGPQHYRYLSDCYFGLRDYAQALYYAEKALASPATAIGSDSDMYRHILESLRQLGRTDQEMLAAAQRAIESFPDLPDFYAEQGMVLCGLEQPGAAVQSFERALLLYDQQQAGNGEASYFAGVIDIVWRRLGELYQLLGDYDKAERYLGRALRQNRYMLEAFVAYYQLHAAESAEQKGAAMAAFFDNTDQNKHYLLSCAAKVGDWDLLQYYAVRIDTLTQQERRLLGLYEQFVAANPELDSALAAEAAQAVHALFLNLLHTDGESAVSRAASELLPLSLQQCLRRYWGDGPALREEQLSDYLTIMPALVQEGDPELLRRYVALAGDFSEDGRLAIGRCLYQHESWEAAAEVYESLADVFCHDASFWREMGIMAMHRDKRQAAVAAFYQAQSLGDTSAEIAACLYWSEKEEMDG